MSTLQQLTVPDWLAFAGFVLAWLIYAGGSRYALRRPTLLDATNKLRHDWMMQTLYRDPRVFDGILAQNLASSPSFFASTTILIIGGLVALLGTSEKALELARELPFIVRTTVQVLDLKILLLLMIFIYAFFRFTWSMRLYTFAGLSIGAMPGPEFFAAHPERGEAFATRSSQLLGIAAETFNDGLRVYYFSFALVAWIVSPWACLAATVLVLGVLYTREFKSSVLPVLRQTV